jgi:hypothetical protein
MDGCRYLNRWDVLGLGILAGLKQQGAGTEPTQTNRTKQLILYTEPTETTVTYSLLHTTL